MGPGAQAGAGVIALSGRFARSLGLLLVLGSIPVLVHSYLDTLVDPCAAPEVLLARFALDPPSAKRTDFLRSSMSADAFAEGSLPGASGESTLRYLVLRSWDPKRLYHQPEQRLLKGLEISESELDWIEVDGAPIPIRSIEVQTNLVRHAEPVAAYLLVYDGEAVENPYVAQIGSAVRQLVGGRLPMTLYFVYGSERRDGERATAKRARAWLADAWRKHREVCSR